MRRPGILLLAAWALGACQPGGGWMEEMLRQRGGACQQVLADPEAYRVQILYTQIDRDAQQVPHFQEFAYRVSADEYFYPASTVKFPAALLALEKLQSLGLGLEYPMLSDSAAPWQRPAWQDSSAPGGLPTAGHYIRKILLVSDNDAFNRLYEWIGQEPLNRRLRALGSEARIVHRLQLPLGLAENAVSPPVRFRRPDGSEYAEPARSYAPCAFPAAPLPIGRGEISDSGDTLRQPKDFREKNHLPLADQQRMLRALVFPAQAPPAQRFRIDSAGRDFLLRHMALLPRESESPRYDSTRHWDSYVKFLLFGDSKAPIPPGIRIYNKIGVAYGFITDNAYIVNEAEGVEFFLSATIYVNRDGIFNDDVYEYDSIGFPFLAELGRAFYAREQSRTRRVRPDFSHLPAGLPGGLR